MASNFLAVEEEECVSRWSKTDGAFIDVKWPAVIQEYNKSMGRVDKADFLVSLYRTNIRSRKWTLRVIAHFMNLVVTISWLEYRRNAEQQEIRINDQMEILDFTLHVVEALAKPGVADVSRQRGRPSSTMQPLKRLQCSNRRPVEDVRYDRIGHWPIAKEEQQRCMLERLQGQAKNQT
ncbi:hypothetical protein MTO96_008741 [Rhipicephalus appendiculatus]